ncbi:MAG: tetratricopeptide repeat protein [Nitrospirota bacterium]|nr:tetratricopeptide repeat protein [Nitrospirota bacterium]
MRPLRQIVLTGLLVTLSVATMGMGSCREESSAMKKANLGRALTERGDTERAIRTLEEALRLDPGLVMTYEFLADAHSQAGHAEQAAGFYRETVRRDPVRDTAFTSLGCLLLSTGGDLEEARQVLEKATEINQTDSRSLACLGALDLESRDFAAAITLSEKAVSLNPQNVQAHLNLGLAYMETGRNEEARREVQTVLAQSQGNEELRGQAQMLLDVLSHPDVPGAGT